MLGTYTRAPFFRKLGRTWRAERGAALLFTATSFIVLIPVVGLAIDASFLYAVRAKLSSAVDASALAAGRSLNQGLTLQAQAAAAEARARFL